MHFNNISFSDKIDKNYEAVLRENVYMYKKHKSGDESMITEITVKQARAGDKMAFQMLYEAIYKDMYRFAYYMLQNKEDAEDAVSDAVYDMYKGIAGLKNSDSFKTWAMRILSIKCKLKQKEYISKRNDEAQDVSELDIVSGQNVEGQVVLKTDIMKAFDTLDDEEKMIVVSSAVAGMSSDEVGSITGLKSATVRTKLRRALAKLKTRLEAGV